MNTQEGCSMLYSSEDVDLNQEIDTAFRKMMDASLERSRQKYKQEHELKLNSVCHLYQSQPQQRGRARSSYTESKRSHDLWSMQSARWAVDANPSKTWLTLTLSIDKALTLHQHSELRAKVCRSLKKKGLSYFFIVEASKKKGRLHAHFFFKATDSIAALRFSKDAAAIKKEAKPYVEAVRSTATNAVLSLGIEEREGRQSIIRVSDKQTFVCGVRYVRYAFKTSDHARKRRYLKPGLPFNKLYHNKYSDLSPTQHRDKQTKDFQEKLRFVLAFKDQHEDFVLKVEEEGELRGRTLSVNEQHALALAFQADLDCSGSSSASSGMQDFEGTGAYNWSEDGKEVDEGEGVKMRLEGEGERDEGGVRLNLEKWGRGDLMTYI